MLKKVLVLALAVLLITVATAQAQVSVTYSSQGREYFTLDIPDNWRVNVGSEVETADVPEGESPQARLITAMPEDNTPLWFGMWVPAGMKKISAAKEYMDSLGIDLLTDVVTTERKFDLLNGMDVYSVSGTGRKEGETMDFRAAFVQLAQETVAIAIYIGPHGTTITHGEELVQMVYSLRPVQP